MTLSHLGTCGCKRLANFYFAGTSEKRSAQFTVSVSVMFHLNFFQDCYLKKKKHTQKKQIWTISSIQTHLFIVPPYLKCAAVNVRKIASVTQCELIKAGEMTWVNNAIVHAGEACDLINKEIVCHSEEGHCVGEHYGLSFCWICTHSSLVVMYDISMHLWVHMNNTAVYNRRAGMVFSCKTSQLMQQGTVSFPSKQQKQQKKNSTGWFECVLVERWRHT